MSELKFNVTVLFSTTEENYVTSLPYDIIKEFTSFDRATDYYTEAKKYFAQMYKYLPYANINILFWFGTHKLGHITYESPKPVDLNKDYGFAETR